MIVKLFTKPDCPRCPDAKAVIDQLSTGNIFAAHKLEKYDVETVDGMAEAAFYTVMSTPSILVCDNSGKELTGWRGKSPTAQELLSKIN